jgi:hypothetical protein
MKLKYILKRLLITIGLQELVCHGNIINISNKLSAVLNTQEYEDK